MDAAGPVAAQQRELFWTVVPVLGFVVWPVLILAPLIAWHYRLSNKGGAYRPNWNFSWILEGFIWIPPTMIVIGLAALLWGYTERLDPYRTIPGASSLEVQAIAFDWKWVFVYPEKGIASVNRLVVPVGRPVRLALTSTTVMQSILIPQLGGQIFAMQGMQTQLNLRADRTGKFRGANMQYNGSGFPREVFVVEAVDPAQFDQWLASADRTAPVFSRSVQAVLAERATVEVPNIYARVPAGYFASMIAEGKLHAAVNGTSQ